MGSALAKSDLALGSSVVLLGSSMLGIDSCIREILWVVSARIAAVHPVRTIAAAPVRAQALAIPWHRHVNLNMSSLDWRGGTYGAQASIGTGDYDDFAFGG